MLLNSALINAEPVSQFVDGNAVGVSLDQLLHLGGIETAADAPRGSSFGRLDPDGTISRRFRRHSPWSEWFK
jgi:hypothetical protein